MTGGDILLADDERLLRKGLSHRLEAEGFTVRAVRYGEEAVAQFRARRPDLLLLDINMPHLDGFAVCTQVRQLDPRVPIIFLTANASEANEVYAFGCGADDFFDKADNLTLLIARIRRALARNAAPETVPNVVKIGTVAVNLDTQLVQDGASTERLTCTEAGILRVLVASRGRWLTKDELIGSLRGAGFACEDGLVYTHLSRLRHKLGTGAELLLTERNSGYCLKDA